MKTEVQPCQSTIESVAAASSGFPTEKDPMLEMPESNLHIFPGGDEVVVLAAMKTCAQFSHVMIQQL